MVKTISFGFIATFWMVMNFLLWRSEFGSSQEIGAAVPLDMVWQKILSAPDDSALEIALKGKKIGYCRWIPNVGEEIATGKRAKETEEQPEGRVKILSGYSINLEGNFLLVEAGGRIRFELLGRFTPQHAWQEIGLRASMKHSSWQLLTKASEQALVVRTEDESSKWEQRFTFEQLAHPDKLLADLGLSFLAGPLAGTGLLANPQQASLGVRWQARQDWLKIGHSQVRVYRLTARLLDRYEAIVMVSRVGEILRVELPNGIVLTNDALLNI